MAKIFGIEEVELEELPDSVKNTLKAAHTQVETDKATSDARIKAIEDRLNPQETEEQKAERIRKEEEARNAAAGVTDPNLLLSLQNRRDVILMQLERHNDPKVRTAIKLFRDKILDSLSRSNPKLWADEAYILNLVNLEVGRNFAAIVADMQKGEGQFNEFFVESNRSQGNNTPPPPDPVKLMTDEEKRAADKLGISYADYAKELSDVREGRF